VELLAALMQDLHPRTTTGALLERWREHEAWPHLQKLAATEMVASEESAAGELRDCLDRLEEERVRRRHEELFEISRAGPLSPEQRAELKSLDARLARRPAAQE
jgi:DNA primase